MFEKALNLFRVEDLRKKIITTLILLAVYRVGFQIPIPGISQARIFEVLRTMEEQGGPGGGLGGILGTFSALSAGGFMSTLVRSAVPYSRRMTWPPSNPAAPVTAIFS